jgi:hypothetical protein
LSALLDTLTAPTEGDDVTELTKEAVLAEVDATKRELTDIMNVESPLRDRVRREQGMDGIQRAVHKMIALRQRLADLPVEPAPQPVVDRAAVRTAVEETAAATGLAKYFKAGGAEDPSDVEEFVAAVMELARPMPTREALVRAIDPDAFDEGKSRSKHPAAVVQWAARRHMAYNAADAVLALINGTAK